MSSKKKTPAMHEVAGFKATSAREAEARFRTVSTYENLFSHVVDDIDSEDHRSTEELRRAVGRAHLAAADLVIYEIGASPSVRRAAAAALEVLIALGTSLDAQNARALGALRSGARTAGQHCGGIDVPTSRSRADELRHYVQTMISRPGRPGGVLARDLALEIFIHFTVLTGTPTIQRWRSVVRAGTDAILKAIPARLRAGSRVFVGAREHVAAVPKRGESPCACPACAATAIVRAAIRATGLPVDAPKKKRPARRSKK